MCDWNSTFSIDLIFEKYNKHLKQFQLMPILSESVLKIAYLVQEEL